LAPHNGKQDSQCNRPRASPSLRNWTYIAHPAYSGTWTWPPFLTVLESASHRLQQRVFQGALHLDGTLGEEVTATAAPSNQQSHRHRVAVSARSPDKNTAAVPVPPLPTDSQSVHTAVPEQGSPSRTPLTCCGPTIQPEEQAPLSQSDLGHPPAK